MQKISIQVEIDFKDILAAAEKLEIAELEVIVKEFNLLLESKKSKEIKKLD